VKLNKIDELFELGESWGFWTATNKDVLSLAVAHEKRKTKEGRKKEREKKTHFAFPDTFLEF